MAQVFRHQLAVFVSQDNIALGIPALIHAQLVLGPILLLKFALFALRLPDTIVQVRETLYLVRLDIFARVDI